MLELTQGLAGRVFDNGRKMVRLVAVHGAHHGEFVNHAAHVREPIRYGNARLTIALKGPENWDHRAFHGGVIVAKTDGVHHGSGEFVVFGIEGIDVADAAAHEKVDNRFRAGFARKQRAWKFTIGGP